VTRTSSQFGNYVGSNKWVGGALGPNGKIYGIPRNATQLLEIDPATKTSALVGTVSSSTNKWFGGVLAKNGKIYGFPQNALEMLEIGLDQPQPSNMVLSRYLNKF
jgi:hypothetical protein